ncbi:hypothetical protein GC175_04075 [bacterium]|nr:hypothetical protein [bacterium]
MPVTLAGLRGQIRTLVRSTADWSDGDLDRFIGDAIRAYSADFPREWRHTLTLATGTQAYALPGGHGFVGVVSVEYPTGEDPPRFLDLVDEWAPYFGAGGQAYALRSGPGDDVDVTADGVAGALVFAETVVTGESAVVVYRGLHHVPVVGADTDIITVPEPHFEALVAFVEFRCHAELVSDESVNPNETSIVLSMLGEQGRRAWNRWREVMQRLRPVGVSSYRLDWSRMGLE